MGRITAYDQNGRMVADFDKSGYDLMWMRQGYEDEIERLTAENAKLRELVRDMGMCLTWQWEPHGYMMDGCDTCRFRGKTGGKCGLGMFRGRMRELGIEVS